ncbi:hypothetical protein [Halomonas lysinitropha]|uniref:Uncharacterized protein n=1 Tax=Halomonas lysinitropha TaxID=2607506 RepID=A0A5K1I8E0_9GAMM|nr:hypothetical protein [Halomonas lysinitropha]VVZ96358.1 hypothetical protein HALO32_02454 [Halomonas lysinitropha]
MPSTSDFVPAHADYRTKVEHILLASPFIRALGLDSDEIAPGRG